jgi:serine protease Do
LDGELIGINTAIASGTGTFMGVGFAIPSKRVQWIVSELDSRGSVRRASLGVTTVELPQQIAVKLNLPIRNGGAYVVRVKSNSPADEAGLQSGDTILQVAEQAVHSPTELSSIIEQSPIGEPVAVQLIRNERRMELSVTLQERKD